MQANRGGQVSPDMIDYFMGNEQHAELQDVHSYAQARALVTAFNKIDQSWIRTVLAFEIRFSEHFTTSFLQSYGQSQISGRLIFQSEAQPDRNVTLTLSRLIDLRDMMLSLKSCNHSTPGNKNDRETCCLCLDKFVTLMLPCAHSYCRECLDKFVLDKEERKCPQCRVEFKEPKRYIQSKLAEIVDEDEKDMVNQIRTNIKELIKQANPRVGEI